MPLRHLMVGFFLAGIALLPQVAGGAEGLPSSAEAVSPVLVGAPVPDGPLKTASGDSTTLGSLLDGKPAVLVFYRGHW